MADSMDIDMDLDIDIGVMDDVTAMETTILEPVAQPQSFLGLNAPRGPLANSENRVPVLEKVHLSGLDNLTSGDIKAFATTYFPDTPFEKIEWIDDSNANLIYSDANTARAALNSFTLEDITSVVDIPVLQMLAAKPFPAHPETKLNVRLATTGDKKQAGARDRSRFYLFNPEYDRAEKRKYTNPRRYRIREDGGYRSQIYDDREQKRRADAEVFDESIYDDDADAIAKREERQRKTQRERRESTVSRSSTDGSLQSRRRGARGRPAHGSRELFPNKALSNGRLRNRSASPARDVNRNGDSPFTAADIAAHKRTYVEASTAQNRQHAQVLKNTLRRAASARSSVELFPRKAAPRTDMDDTADLFAAKIAMTDNGGTFEERLPISTGMSIKGRSTGTIQGISIKGLAAQEMVKELFPAKTGANAGKELFGSKLEGRGGPRKKAQDLFSSTA